MLLEVKKNFIVQSIIIYWYQKSESLSYYMFSDISRHFTYLILIGDKTSVEIFKYYLNILYYI